MFADTKRTQSRDDPWRDDEEADAANEHDDEADNLAAARSLLYGIGIASLIWLLFNCLVRLI